MKKVLIIGSNGWLASRIAAMLKERKGGAVVIRGFDILPCKPGVAVDEFVQGLWSGLYFSTEVITKPLFDGLNDSVEVFNFCTRLFALCGFSLSFCDKLVF